MTSHDRYKRALQHINTKRIKHVCRKVGDLASAKIKLGIRKSDDTFDTLIADTIKVTQVDLPPTEKLRRSK